MTESVTTTRVRYPEVDRMGVAHHVAYPVWFEIGRTELMREAGVPYSSLEDGDGVLFPVIELGVRYLAPARYDQRIEIRTTLAEIAGIRVRFLYRIADSDGTRLLATGFSVHAACHRDGRPRRIPEPIRRALAPWVAEEGA